MGDLWLMAQVVGFIGMIVGFGVLLSKSDKVNLIGTGIGETIDSAHWFMLNANLAGWISLLIASRVFVAANLKTKKVPIAIVYSITFMGCAWLTWQDIYSWFPLISTLAATFIYFYSDQIKMRIGLIFCNVPWMIYSVHVKSIAGFVAAVVSALFLVIAITRIVQART